MSQLSLITRERALRNFPKTPTTAEDKLIDSLIAACSDWIRRYCRRDFKARQFDEMYSGDEQVEMILRQFPVLSIERIAYQPTTVLQVENTLSTNQRATATVTDTGITLIRVASGTTTIDTSVTFASNTTINALKTAIDALGSGWKATIPTSDYENWPSADLKPQGAYNCAGQKAGLKLHAKELNEYELDRERGILVRQSWSEVDAFHQNSVPLWYGGHNYWRIIYTAGYSSVPEAVQEACAEMTMAFFWQAKRDPALTQEQIVGSVSRSSVLTTKGVSPSVLNLLAPYKRYA
jgi:hypothetical protein